MSEVGNRVEAPGPAISVVVPSYRRAPQVVRCARGFLDDGAEQVVVVLDGIQPESRSALEAIGDPRLVIVELEHNVGLALARIRGLRAAAHEVVMLVDDDVEPLPGLVDRHRALHAAGENVVGVGYMPVHLTGDPGHDDAATRIYAREYEETTGRWAADGGTVPLGELWNGNVSLRRSLHEAAERGRPSVALAYNEDLDLGLRLAEHGATATFLPDARAVHHHRRSTASLPREAISRGESAAVLEGRWGTLPPSIDDLVNRRLGPLTPVVVAGARSRPVSLALTRVLCGVSRILRWVRRYRAEELCLRLMRRFLAVGAYHRARTRAGT